MFLHRQLVGRTQGVFYIFFNNLVFDNIYNFRELGIREQLLIDAFNQFNIPHQPGISANAAIPDGATVELFVAKKP